MTNWGYLSLAPSHPYLIFWNCRRDYGKLCLYGCSIIMAARTSISTCTNKVNCLYWYSKTRLLHSPSLMSGELSVGHETWWPLIGWHHTLVTGWSKYRFRLLQSQSISGSHDQWEFPAFLKRPWQSPWTALTAGICRPLVLCKETVKESTSRWQSFLTLGTNRTEEHTRKTTQTLL